MVKVSNLVIIFAMFVIAYIIYKLLYSNNKTTIQSERYFESTFDGKLKNVGTITLYTDGVSTLQPITGYKVSQSISDQSTKQFSRNSTMKVTNLSPTFNPNFQIIGGWTIGSWRKPVDQSVTKMWFPYSSTIQYDPQLKALIFSNFTTANIGSSFVNYPGGIQPILTIYIAWY